VAKEFEQINDDNCSAESLALAESSSIQATASKYAIRSKILSVVLCSRGKV